MSVKKHTSSTTHKKFYVSGEKHISIVGSRLQGPVSRREKKTEKNVRKSVAKCLSKTDPTPATLTFTRNLALVVWHFFDGFRHGGRRDRTAADVYLSSGSLLFPHGSGARLRATVDAIAKRGSLSILASLSVAGQRGRARHTAALGTRQKKTNRHCELPDKQPVNHSTVGYAVESFGAATGRRKELVTSKN